MGGTKLAHERRVAEGFFERFIHGKGIDIGHGNETLTKDCRGWDLQDGDATYLKGLADESFDWVYSSHCLEHLEDYQTGLRNWWRILKPGGYLIIAVPDFVLYEHEIWPSHFNGTHKTRWRVEPVKGCLGLREEMMKLPGSELVYCRLVDTNFDHSWEKREQGQSETAEVIVEGVVRKI